MIDEVIEWGALTPEQKWHLIAQIESALRNEK